jgi:hypothetical protein
MLFKDTNQIKRNYYLNLFSANAEIVKNGNNNFMYEWNIRDLQLGKYAEIALVQLASINADITVERQYPPKLFNSASGETTATGELQNILPTTFYKQTLTLNTSAITYGFGDYIIYSSSVYESLNSLPKSLLFNSVLLNDGPSGGGAGFQIGLYTQPAGTYNSSSYIKSDYLGDWIIIKCPNPIILTKFAFQARTGLIDRSPGEFKVYGSNDGINWIEIKEASQMTRLKASDYVNGYYSKSFNNLISYIYIGFTINKIVGGTANSNMINFYELQLFGREKLNTLNPATWYKFDKNFLTIDSSGNKTLTNINNVSTNTDDFIVGTGSAQFNGSNYFQIDEPSYFSPNNSFSISLWMKLTNVNNEYKTIFSCRSGTSGYNIYIIPTSHNIEIWLPNGINNWNPTLLLSNYFGSFTNIWKLFTLTFNKRTSDYEIKLYLDGKLINTIINTTYVPNTNFSLRIGAGANETTAQFFLNNGSLIDDFRFYNRTLTPAEVLEIYYGTENKYIIRCLNTYNDNYDSQNTTSAILYMSNELTSPKQPSYHKLNTYSLNRISLQVSNDINTNKPYNGWNSNIQFGAVFHICDYGDFEGTNNI